MRQKTGVEFAQYTPTSTLGETQEELAMRTSEQVAAMPCPVCRVPLVMSDRQGIEIDYCPQCRGVWLDRGELDKIIDRSVAPAPSAPLVSYI